MNYQLIQQMNYPQQMNYSQMQNNQNYNNILQQLNNEKLKNKKLEEEIQRLKNKINELTNNNNNLKQRLGNTNQLNQINQFNQMNINEINNLRQIIIQKDKEINELKLKIPNNNVNMNDIVVINFKSSDKKMSCGIPCLLENTFAEVEEKLYQQFGEYRNTNNLLLFKGNKILIFKKIKENNIHNGDTIELVKQK